MRDARTLETYRLRDDGRFPNSALPLLVYRAALRGDAGLMQQTFAAHGWANEWRNGIFTYHHFHSTAHEVLGIAAGEVEVLFGGPSGETVEVRAGDVVVVPAGVAHCNLGQSGDLLVVGAYPGGSDYDLCRGEPGAYAAARMRAAAVPADVDDPVDGGPGRLRAAWRPAA